MAITPPWPKPLPYTANVLRRLKRGWSSWFGLLNEWDFRIALGELNLLGLRVFLVNDRTLLRRVLVQEEMCFLSRDRRLICEKPSVYVQNGQARF